MARFVETVEFCPMTKPFLKWVGGKSQIGSAILGVLPTSIRTYYEPFVGGGAIFFLLSTQGRFERAILNDKNRELINCYQMVRDSADELMLHLREVESEYSKDPKGTYMLWREKIPEGKLLQAVRTIFLNKAGFNGLYRVNQKGQFNVPWGKREAVTTFDEGNIRACSEALRQVDLQTRDFSEAAQDAGPGDVVYFDPPYFPQSATSNFTSYTKDKFNGYEQTRLRDFFKKLAERGAFVALSNSDCPESRQLYQGHEMIELQARRNVNSKGSSRGPVAELLIVGRQERNNG